MAAFYLLTASGMAFAAAQSEDPDALYADRGNMAHAKRAADIWADRSAGGRDFEAAWKLSRACYWLGTQGPMEERRAALDRGVKSGELAARLGGGKPEGHFWLAANMGALAESFGLIQGLKYRGRIKDELETVLRIDSAWQYGSADRALGWWYFKVPGLFGGSRAKAREHLQRALSQRPQSIVTLVFLAEVTLADGRKDEARRLLQQAIDAPLDPDWVPEDRAYQRQAQARLRDLAGKPPAA